MFKKILITTLALIFISSAGHCYTRDWANNDPIDHTLNSQWPAKSREIMVDVSERLSEDMEGFTAGETATHFKQVQMEIQGSSPASETNIAQFFVKEVAAKAEIFFIDEDGNEMQLTSVGSFIGGMQGEIRMWSGTIADIPTGWELADGSCSITCPDLTDRFIVGADQDDSGAAKTNITGSLTVTGGDVSHTHGAATGSHTLIASEMPAHTHTFDESASGTGGNGPQISEGTSEAATSTLTSSSTGGGGGHDHTIASDDHLPSYYALAFIIKT